MKMGVFSEKWSFATIKYKLTVSFLCIFCAGYMLFTIQSSALRMDFEVERSETTEVNFFEKLEHVNMKQRTIMVKRKCGSLWKPKPLYDFKKDDLPPRPLISDRYKVFGCKAAKVASTNLQRIFYILNGLANKTNTEKVNKGAARKHTNEFFQNRRSVGIEAQLDRLKTYTTFMFVRHPLERFVSAYRDNKPNGFFRPLRKKSKVPSFHEYIDYILEPRTRFSRPVSPLYMLCKPCEIQYDFVGSLDDFDDDIKTILKAIGAENAVTIPRRNETGYKQKKSSMIVKEFYKDIPKDKIEKLEKLHDIDYLIFGFERYSDMT